MKTQIEEINDFWVPSNDKHIDQWKAGLPFTQNKCLNNFINYCDSQKKKFKRVLDVGAWCGTWSVAMEKYIKNIDAFEPDRVHFACLERNVARFSDRIKSHRFAIGNEEGEISLTTEEATQKTRVKGKGDIPMHTIDYFNYKDVEMIKIDVEGYEMEVLKGAHKTLTFNDENQSNVKFLMVELNHNTEKYESSNKEVKEHIVKNLGFKILMSQWPDIVYYRV
jgi:FkbM family methyltransferase|tara:strand:- start:345 stop:1010 length:666 start_codon:yes stop_codon:yes gene_type:complete